MPRATTRRSPRTKPSRKTRRRFDPKRLPYAEEAQTVTDVFKFLTRTLPELINTEFERLDVARDEAELFRMLSALPDSTLRRAGLRREELPRYVLSVFHVVNTAAKCRRTARHRGAPASRRTGSRANRAATRTMASAR